MSVFPEPARVSVPLALVTLIMVLIGPPPGVGKELAVLRVRRGDQDVHVGPPAVSVAGWDVWVVRTLTRSA